MAQAQQTDGVAPEDPKEMQDPDHAYKRQALDQFHEGYDKAKSAAAYGLDDEAAAWKSFGDSGAAKYKGAK